MSSQFFGLEIAHTGLTAFMASINTTANNVSNAKTKGYSKQRVNLEAQTALRVYQKYGSTSTGVLATDVKRSRDDYYDQKYWSNQKSYGFYDRLNYYMPQIENFFVDNSSNPGFSTLFGNMFNSLDSLSKDAGNMAIRTEVASNAEKMTDYFNSTASQLTELQETVNDEIKTTVDQINAISKKISLLNKQINVIELQGSSANDLRDSRDLLVDELASIIPIEVNEASIVNSNYPDMKTGATSFTIKVNGNILVKDKDCNELECTTRVEKMNQDDIDGLYDIRWKRTQATFELNGATADGRLKALFMIRDGNDEENLTGTIVGPGEDGTSSTTTGTSADADDAGTTTTEDSIIPHKSTSTAITLTNPSITDIASMNMPESGQIMIDNTVYQYSHFDFITDNEGNVESYTFYLENPIDGAKLNKAAGTRASIGESVNYKGIPYYQNQLNNFLRNFTKAFNDIQLAGADRNGNKGQVFFVANDINGENTFDWNVTAAMSAGMTGATAKNAVDDAKYKEYTEAVDGADNTFLRKNGSGDNTYYRLTASNAGVSDAVRRNAAVFSATSYYEMADKWDGSDPYDSLMSDTSVYKLKDDTATDVSGSSSGSSTGSDGSSTSGTAIGHGTVVTPGNVDDILNGNITTVEDKRIHLNKGIDASDLVSRLLKLESDTKLFRGGGANDFLQVIYADITVDTQEADVFNDNYTNIQKEIDTQRQSVSGVDEDEEALDLVKFQNAYNLSAKVISTLAEMYDQLILNTGV